MVALAPLFIAAFDRGSFWGAAYATTSSGGQPLHPIYVLHVSTTAVWGVLISSTALLVVVTDRVIGLARSIS
jgi:hypothetical protein